MTMKMAKTIINQAFSVRRQEPSLIAPAKPTPFEVKYLSDIDDQEGLRFQVPFIMFYGNNRNGSSNSSSSVSFMQTAGRDPVKVIKDAVAKALVYYYPLAGRLREGPNRQLMVDCSAEGVLFVEADADICLDQLGILQPPFPYVDEVLFDVPASSGIVGCPLLLIQVTRLICGGFIFAIRLNHTISDTIGLIQFLNAVGEMVRGANKPSKQPVWQREMFSARTPFRVTFVHHEFEEVAKPKAKNLPTVESMNPENMVHKSFFFSSKDLSNIRKLLPPHLATSSSTFDLLTACVWRSRTIALELDPGDQIVRLSCMMTGRGKPGLQVPAGYYGNVFAYVTAVSSAKFLSENPLGYAVDLVKKAKSQMCEEYLKSEVDYMVREGRPKYTTELNYIVADASRVGFADLDLGWGKAFYGGPIGAISIITLYAQAKNNQGEDGIAVPIILLKPIMDKFERELEKLIQVNCEECPKIVSML